jgi:hypothetical protein
MDSPHSLRRVKDGPTPECLRSWAITGVAARLSALELLDLLHT